MTETRAPRQNELVPTGVSATFLYDVITKRQVLPRGYAKVKVP